MITHPEKLLFPDDGITKGDLAAYYDMIAPVMLPHIEGRPVTMERFHRGIKEEGFFQKNVARGFPAWLQRVPVEHKSGTVHYPIVTDERSLLWMANQNSITPHVWTARAPELFYPDVCVFDLDPLAEEPAVLGNAAVALRELLHELGLPSWIKTSGSKGFHVVVPLDRKSSYDVVGRFAGAVADILVQRDPDHLTLEFHKVDRAGRILVDTGRNGYGATFAAAYAVRARPGAPVSAPCSWREVEDGSVGPRTFTLRNMADRVGAVGDLWRAMLDQPQSLGSALASLQRS